MWWPLILLLAMCGLALCAGNTWAAPITYGFYNITNNNPGDAAIGEARLFVDVDAYGSNQVLFTFRNIGPEDSSIADVYFDDGTLLGIASIDNWNNGEDGVSFSQLATPAELPGGNVVGFETTAGFSADSDSPAQPNGVNPGEYLGIVFDLQDGKIFNDVINDLSTGALRIGIHVQGFESDGSEGFVNVVPIPSALLLLGTGLLGLFGVSRKLKD